jgi:hypothetical protein
MIRMENGVVGLGEEIGVLEVTQYK